jgi:hypothetical protein
MGAEQSDQKGQLAGFCCNTNLCNNDSNIENKTGMDSGSNQYRKNNFRKAGHNSNASGHKITNGSKRDIPNQLS